MDFQRILEQGYGFAVYPSVFLYDAVETFNKKTKLKELKWKQVKHLIFGDYIRILLANERIIERVVKGKKYIKVRGRSLSGFIDPGLIQFDRLLEVNFVDIGQGDGCHVVTPENKHYIIDAGQGDNMYRFLRWRYNLKKSDNSPPPFIAVISHPDSDHYNGFGYLFRKELANKKQFSFSTVYHNGILEHGGKPEAEKLGGSFTAKGITYIEELYEDDASVKQNLDAPGKKLTYQNTLQAAKKNHPGLTFSALWKEDTLVKKFLENSAKLSIEVLAPFIEQINGKKVLRYFKSKGSNDNGKTKNGHSVALKLEIGNVKILLGGDLNPPAEDYLLERYTGKDIGKLRMALSEATKIKERERLLAEINQCIEAARKYFQVDFAKSCHHGSADFTSEFLQAINPLATVISSGDDEPHCHPRPDTLGTIGRYSRGERSLIFSTELMRSGKEFLNIKKFAEAMRKERVVTVYGMINLRTDGTKAIVAQMYERSKGAKRFDIHKFEWNETMQTMEFIMK